MTTDIRIRTPLLAGALALAVAGLAGCGATDTSAQAKSHSAAPAAAPAIAAWALPVQAGAQPDLARAPDGSLLLSWVEGEGPDRSLRFARFQRDVWSKPSTIARGDWFGNSTDTPHLRQTPDGALWAVWMRRSSTSGHARDIVLARSGDGGANWSRAVPVNNDVTPTEHGFVSTWPAGRDRIGVAWLDGRAKAGGGAGHHGAADAMTMLRSMEFDRVLARGGETAIDTSVCDCCHTDAVATPTGPLVVYRDRAPGEVRDIVVTRLRNGAWTSARRVNADGWVMPGCPVNGPAAAADARTLAVGWYTGVGSAPSIRYATSSDGGGTFHRTVEVDRGAAVLGRVDIALVGGSAWLGWVREDARSQSLWLAQLTQGAEARVVRRMRIADLAGRGRGTGMPRVVPAGDRVHLVWTDLVDGKPRMLGRTVSGL